MLQQPYHKDFFLDLDEDVDTFDFLSLRRDQQLEYAKEHNSIIPEPFGSRLRPRCALSIGYNLSCCLQYISYDIAPT